MLQTSITIKGDQAIVNIVNDLASFPKGALAEIFSIGAVQRGRRYDQFVQGPERQAAIHQGRWQTTKSVANEQADMVADKVADTVDDITEGRGFGRSHIKEATEKIEAEMRKYPPPPPNSTYSRTGTLRESWRSKVLV